MKYSPAIDAQKIGTEIRTTRLTPKRSTRTPWIGWVMTETKTMMVAAIEICPRVQPKVCSIGPTNTPKL